MPRLKDYLASDLDAFLNPDDFAEAHDIDGQQVICVVDSDILKERPRLITRGFSDGVYLGDIVLFVKLSDIIDRPVMGQHLRLDGQLYLVNKCDEADGLLEITLEANEA